MVVQTLWEGELMFGNKHHEITITMKSGRQIVFRGEISVTSNGMNEITKLHWTMAPGENKQIPYIRIGDVESVVAR